MMHILDVWRQSFALLQLEQLKSFFLINFKSVVRLFKNLFKFFWQGFLGFSIILLAQYYYGSYLPNDFWWILYNVLIYFSLFVVVLFARSSVKEKGFDTIKELFFINPVALSVLVLMSMFNLYMLPVVLLISFFYFDSCLCFKGLLRSISNALKMIVYNAPLFFLLYLLFVGAVVVLIKSKLGVVAAFLLLPIFVTLLITFYQKRLYDNFTIYKIT